MKAFFERLSDAERTGKPLPAPYPPRPSVMTILDALAAEDPGTFVKLGLSPVDQRSLRYLEWSWGMVVEAIDQQRQPTGAWSITSEGRRQLARLHRRVANPKHKDGLCPRCRINAKHVRANGVIAPYCTECARAIKREAVAAKKERGEKIVHPKPRPRKCSRCKVNDNGRTKSGAYMTYCHACMLELQNERSARRLARIQADIAVGKPIPLCSQCNERPIAITHDRALYICDECRRANASDARRRRIRNQILKRHNVTLSK